MGLLGSGRRLAEHRAELDDRGAEVGSRASAVSGAYLLHIHDDGDGGGGAVQRHAVRAG